MAGLKEDRNVILARVAERAERYDEMADFMKERAENRTPLNGEERDMFSAAFKNALSERRAAIRTAVNVERQEAANGNSEFAELAHGYRSKLEAELQQICNKVLTLLESVLVPENSSVEALTFYLKMQGDYWRYLAEFAHGDARTRAAEQAKEAYSRGMQEAHTLPTTHPVRLGLALNFSVFQHEVLLDTSGAVYTANTALSVAAEQLESVSEDSRQDAILTMQLLSDNLSLWGGAAQEG